MEHHAAIQLISRAAVKKSGPQHWADLGCGSGTFTRALAHLLPDGSVIDAVDKGRQILPARYGEVRIISTQADFEKEVLQLHALDGILLANSLHYCRDAAAVLARLISLFQPGHVKFLVVEYDLSIANRWIPYPLAFEKMKRIFEGLQFDKVEKLGEQPSLFRRENMYACEALRSF